MKMEWETKKLGAVCKIVNGGTPKTSVPEYWDGDHLWITPAEMGKRLNPYVANTERKITDIGLRNSSAQMLPPESVILSSRAPIGHLVINTAPMATNQGCKGLIPTNELHYKYLYYYLLSSVNLLNSLGSGTTFKELSGGKLKDIEIPIPALTEQLRIIGILDKAFDGIATAKANAEKSIQNSHLIFSSELDKTFFKHNKNWVEKPLSSLCDIKHGFAFDGAEFSNNISDSLPIVITPGNFSESGEISFTERNTKRFIGDPPAAFRFNVGDLVVVMTDLSSKMKILGIPAFIDRVNVLHNQRIGRVIFLTNEIDKRFVYYFMMSDRFLSSIKRTATGTMVKHTAPRRILENALSFPIDKKAQQAVVKKLSALREDVHKLTSIYKRKSMVLEDLKKSFLHQAFTGAL